MHVKYLGTDQYLFGSILELLVSWVLDGSPEENLKRVWASLQEAYNSLRTPVQQRYRYLNRLTMFMRSGYAKLRGKASEIRHLGKALQIVWLKFYNKRLGVHRDIALILKLNCAMESIIEDNRSEYAFPPEAATRFRRPAVTVSLDLKVRMDVVALVEILANIANSQVEGEEEEEGELTAEEGQCEEDEERAQMMPHF
eukprot:s2_g3.t1